MLGLGILGLGEGRSTMSAAIESSKWDLKMICDRNEALCRQRADEFKMYEYTTNYQDMLDDEGIDT
jgi:predicted dehydrogenase